MTIETSASTTAVTSAPRSTTGRHRGRPWPLILLELLVAASATYGGVGLMWHDAIHMPDEWLEGTPFTSWVIPGVLLLVVVAAPMTVAAWLELRRSRWSMAGSVVSGAALIGWIAAELFIMQRYNVLQPVMLCSGLAVVLVALWAHRHQPPLLPRSDVSAS
jgi:hypothetical protein